MSGATIYAINTTDGTLEGSDTSDVNGDYSIDVTAGKTYHVCVEYESGGTKYNAYSKPFIAIA